MNYTIIGYTDSETIYDRYGDSEHQTGKFDIRSFRNDEKDLFLTAWARAECYKSYENITILLDGIPDNNLNDEEWEVYETLERDMKIICAELDIEKQAAMKLKREADALKAAAREVHLKQLERQRDLQQLEYLKRKFAV